MKKKLVFNGGLACIIILALGCNATKTTSGLDDISLTENELFNKTAADTVQITSEETEYEIIIIDPGFNVWLQSIARPEGYYSQHFLENRNQILVTNWNQRVLQPQQYDPNLYMMQIDYDPNIDYGYEVNYKLYNYFVYFQRKYKQRLGPFLPRI